MLFSCSLMIVLLKEKRNSQIQLSETYLANNLVGDHLCVCFSLLRISIILELVPRGPWQSWSSVGHYLPYSAATLDPVKKYHQICFICLYCSNCFSNDQDNNKDKHNDSDKDKDSDNDTDIATLRLHARSCCKKQKQNKLNPNTLDPVQQKQTN